MRIQYEGLALPVSATMTNYLIGLLKDHDLSNSSAVTISFRDPDYSFENGGYHPVEIMLRHKSEEWLIQYISTFCYLGVDLNSELVKDLHFDFRQGQLRTLYLTYEMCEMKIIYDLWEANFLSYAENLHSIIYLKK
jgi:hypothetical protein